MALGKAHGAEGGLVRPLAMLAGAIALGLLCWRGAALLTGPSRPAAANPAEAALAEVLAPVAGPGLSRLSVTYNAEGGRTVLILVDDTAAARIPDLQRIAPLAAGLIPEQGDRLVIETVAFAGGVPGRPDAAAWVELAGLGFIVLIAGGIVLSAGGPAPKRAPVAEILPAPAAVERPREAPRPLRPVPAPQSDAAADLARRDPAKAAAVVRGWMKSGEETA